MLIDLSENFNKEVRNMKMEIENIKKDQSEMKDTIDEEHIRGNQQQIRQSKGSNQ